MNSIFEVFFSSKKIKIGLMDKQSRSINKQIFCNKAIVFNYIF